MSAEEKAISDRIAVLRNESPAPAPGPLAERDADDAEWRPPTDPQYRPNPKKQRLQAGWNRAPFAKKTNDFEKAPLPKVEQTKTVLVRRVELQQRDAWKIAAAGAGLAALLGSIAIFFYFEMTSRPPKPPPPVITTPVPTTPTPTPSPAPTPDPIPSAAPTPAPIASPSFVSPWRRRAQPPPPPAPRTTTDEADRLLSGALGAPSGLGAITVVCMPKCDQTTDNGIALGPGHIFNRPTPAGRHVLVLSAPNGVKKTVTINVADGVTREIRVSMEAPAPPPTNPLPTPTTPVPKSSADPSETM